MPSIFYADGRQLDNKAYQCRRHAEFAAMLAMAKSSEALFMGTHGPDVSRFTPVAPMPRQLASREWDTSGDFPESSVYLYHPMTYTSRSAVGGIVYRGGGLYDVWRYASLPDDRWRRGVYAPEAMKLLDDVIYDRPWAPLYVLESPGKGRQEFNTLETALLFFEAAEGESHLFDRYGAVVAEAGLDDYDLSETQFLADVGAEGYLR